VGVLSRWDRRNQRVLHDQNEADPAPNAVGFARSQALVSGFALLRIAAIVGAVVVAGVAAGSPGGLVVAVVAVLIALPFLWSLGRDVSAVRRPR
jgi:hypothetical protein